MNKILELTDESTKVEVLKLAYEKQLEAALFHHELAYKIFSWANTILLAILGFTLTQQNMTTQNRLFLTIAVLILFFVVTIWQSRNRIESIEHAENIARIDDLFHLKETGYFGGDQPVYIRKWHAKLPIWRARLGIIHYNIAVLAMTAVVLVALWL